LIDFEEEG
jgi:hypothetical protein